MITSIELELNSYIHELNSVQKKALLAFLKTIVPPITIKQYNRELEEAESAIDRGEFYTHEEVKEMSKKLINAGKNVK